MQLEAESATASVRPLAFEEAVVQGAGERLPAAMQALHSVKVQLHVRVGQASMTVRDLLEARSNDVLPLDRGVNDPVDLLLEGKVVARGYLVAVGDKFGVQIVELPSASANLASSG
jgi:flagellar motor switch protein FliN/FliY